MQRRMFSGEFKFEAGKLIKEQGVAVSQAARDLDVAESALRRWLREGVADSQHAFPGHGPSELE
jgi:transposase-like protein